MKKLLPCFLICASFMRITSLHADITGLIDPVNILQQAPLGGDFYGMRSAAAEHGVGLTVQSVSDMLGNVSGGMSKGGAYAGLVDIGVIADLGKAVGWEGASFKSTWLWLYGNNLSSRNVGNAMTVSGIYGAPTFRCYELWMQQNLLSDAISLRAGLLGLDSEFGIYGSDSIFLNTTFGVSSGVTMNLPNGGPTYPEAAPGVRLALQTTSWLTLRGALTQGNPFGQEQNLYGFNWNFGPAGGLLSMNEAEFSWCKDPSSEGLKGYLKTGFWIETGSGAPGQLQFGSPTTTTYSTGFYTGFDQQLFKVRDSGGTKGAGKNSISSDKQASGGGGDVKGLSAFVQASFSPQSWSPCSFYADTGFIYTGLIPGRDADKAGIAFVYAQMGELCSSTASRSGCPGSGYEALTELTYSIRVAPAIAIQPDLQYIIHPGGTQQYGNALVVGVRAVIDF